MVNKNNKGPVLSLDTFLVIVIALCIIFLNTFTTSKLSEMDRVNTESLFIKDDLNFVESDELREEFVKYRPGANKMIEVYNASFDLIFSLKFDDMYSLNNNIRDFPELVDLFSESKEGQTTISIGKYRQDVYFQWLENTNGEMRLVIVYNTREVVNNIWLFSFMCYIVLILVFILLIRVHNRSYASKIKHYKQVSDNVRYEVNRK